MLDSISTAERVADHGLIEDWSSCFQNGQSGWIEAAPPLAPSDNSLHLPPRPIDAPRRIEWVFAQASI